jgi:S1-C subfamily serine protease
MLLAALVAITDLTAFTVAAQPSIVLIEEVDSTGNPVGSGTGFFVSPDGRLATNHHVIEGAERLRVVLSDGKKHDVVGIVADDPDHDLAVLKVDGNGFPALRLGAALALQPGTPIAIVGHPLGMSASVADGTIAAVRKAMPDRLHVKIQGEIVQLNALIAHGNSGSPVQTRDGVVVGIATFMIEGLAFAVPVERLQELLKAVPAGAKLRAVGNSETMTNWLISGGLAAAALVGLAGRRVARARAAKRVALHVMDRGGSD